MMLRLAASEPAFFSWVFYPFPYPIIIWISIAVFGQWFRPVECPVTWPVHSSNHWVTQPKPHLVHFIHCYCLFISMSMTFLIRSFFTQNLIFSRKPVVGRFFGSKSENRSYQKSWPKNIQTAKSARSRTEFIDISYKARF